MSLITKYKPSNLLQMDGQERMLAIEKYRDATHKEPLTRKRLRNQASYLKAALDPKYFPILSNPNKTKKQMSKAAELTTSVVRYCREALLSMDLVEKSNTRLQPFSERKKARLKNKLLRELQRNPTATYCELRSKGHTYAIRCIYNDRLNDAKMDARVPEELITKRYPLQESLSRVLTAVEQLGPTTAFNIASNLGYTPETAYIYIRKIESEGKVVMLDRVFGNNTKKVKLQDLLDLDKMWWDNSPLVMMPQSVDQQIRLGQMVVSCLLPSYNTTGIRSFAMRFSKSNLKQTMPYALDLIHKELRDRALAPG
ncbi:MAG: hypothetical protein KGH61_00185 [Candidatus Micrarchaeota archaeon]|nr:hypothetical protein [Candidatus Micrarchaeota archaeon]MDE1847354.1 hypothetical protein [Candidatus Micrarchaeota archaeon]MDE1863969.1 hypothetical protein [Candidatus Micrarchaeota archaeon]